MKKETIIIALGGNALIQKNQKGTAEEQLANLVAPMKAVVDLLDKYNVIITHGNGPQVGNILLQQESCSEVPKMPFALVGAETQGLIGFMIESVLRRELADAGRKDQKVIALVSPVVVDKNDPAFQNPTKPVGPFYPKEKAAGLPYPLKETPHGFRRVVASPEPLEIVNADDVKMLSDAGYVVICTGGGGVPVKREGNSLEGVDAVIDKDYASSLLARTIKADQFLIATDEPNAFLDYAKPTQRPLETVKAEEARKYMKEGQFPAGSIGPKMEAVTRFAEDTGKAGIITSIDKISDALEGKAGTRVVR